MTRWGRCEAMFIPPESPFAFQCSKRDQHIGHHTAYTDEIPGYADVYFEWREDDDA